MSIRKTISWMAGLILIGVGIWCLYKTAQSGLFTIQNVLFRIQSSNILIEFDMRINTLVSAYVAMIFSFLFCFSGAFLVFGNTDKHIDFHPTLLRLVMVVAFVVLSILVLSKYQATSKVTWEESRGLPFTFLTVTEMRGPCIAGLAFWKCRIFDNVNLLLLIPNVLLVYSAICICNLAFSKLQRHNLEDFGTRYNNIGSIEIG